MRLFYLLAWKLSQGAYHLNSWQGKQCYSHELALLLSISTQYVHQNSDSLLQLCFPPKVLPWQKSSDWHYSILLPLFLAYFLKTKLDQYSQPGPDKWPHRSWHQRKRHEDHHEHFR